MYELAIAAAVGRSPPPPGHVRRSVAHQMSVDAGKAANGPISSYRRGEHGRIACRIIGKHNGRTASREDWQDIDGQAVREAPA